MNNELEKRYSSQACEILTLANVFHPRNLKQENSGQAQQLAKFYGIHHELVANQFILLSNSHAIKCWKDTYEEFLKMKEKAEHEASAKTTTSWLCLPTLLKVFGENSMSDMYPDLYELVRIVATLPATVASCDEQAHSKVKIVNNYLRASMSDDRLEHLVHISIERDFADKIELDTLVDAFKTAKNRKLPL